MDLPTLTGGRDTYDALMDQAPSTGPRVDRAITVVELAVLATAGLIVTGLVYLVAGLSEGVDPAYPSGIWAVAMLLLVWGPFVGALVAVSRLRREQRLTFWVPLLALAVSTAAIVFSFRYAP